MPEANSETLRAFASFNYPKGFSNKNCVVISLMSHNTLHEDQWSTMGIINSASVVSGNGNLHARLTSQDIVITVEKMNTAEQRRDVTFRLVLMKLPEISATAYTLGDVNEDGQITQDDLTLVQNYIQGTQALTDKQLKAADVNKDGKVNSGDSLLISKYINGSISSFE